MNKENLKYTPDNEIKYYKKCFGRWIKSDKWDLIAERLSETSMETITHIMNAKPEYGCSWVLLANCDYVLDRIRHISKEL